MDNPLRLFKPHKKQVELLKAIEKGDKIVIHLGGYPAGGSYSKKKKQSDKVKGVSDVTT